MGMLDGIILCAWFTMAALSYGMFMRDFSALPTGLRDMSSAALYSCPGKRNFFPINAQGMGRFKLFDFWVILNE